MELKVEMEWELVDRNKGDAEVVVLKVFAGKKRRNKG